MKNLVVLILLAGVITMNTSMFCQSLCIAEKGHQDNSQSHAAHHGKHSEKGHKAHEGAMCPASHADDCPHHDDHSEGTFIKCHCSGGDKGHTDFDTALIKPNMEMVSYIHLVSGVDTLLQTYSSREPVPLTGPPELLS